MIDHRDVMREEILKRYDDRGWKIGYYIIGGAVLGAAITIGSLIYEATKLENVLNDPIKDPAYVWIGLGIMAASQSIGASAYLINMISKDRKLKNLDEIVPALF